MMWTIPGTTLTGSRGEADGIARQFQSMFLAGGLTLSQVATITGLESYAIQNWVKRGFLTSPVGKRYSLRQLCRILNINMLRGSMPIERICQLLSYVNGDLSDESDDMIDDSRLYFMFVKLAVKMKELRDYEAGAKLLDSYLADYVEPVSGARARVREVLKIMLSACLAARMMQETEKMMEKLQ
jgi:DNA-binding transcriptional MerR regulator